MGQFLRDQHLTNLNIDEATLVNLNDFLVAQAAGHNAAVAAQIAGQPPQAIVGKALISFYVIRFDEKGYRFINFADVTQHYASATYVERVIFTQDSGENRQTQGLIGANVELRLDAKDANSCRLTVTSDNQAWVDATFTGVTDILNRRRSFSRFVRTQWTGLVIQLFGVIAVFSLSLWAAVIIAPYLKVENAFVISLIFTLLIFSNLWTYGFNQLARLIDYAFPNVRFKRYGKGPHWLTTGLIVGLVSAGVIYVLNKLFALAGNILGTFIGQ